MSPVSRTYCFLHPKSVGFVPRKTRKISKGVTGVGVCRRSFRRSRPGGGIPRVWSSTAAGSRARRRRRNLSVLFLTRCDRATPCPVWLTPPVPERGMRSPIEKICGVEQRTSRTSGSSERLTFLRKSLVMTGNQRSGKENYRFTPRTRICGHTALQPQVVVEDTLRTNSAWFAIIETHTQSRATKRIAFRIV